MRILFACLLLSVQLPVSVAGQDNKDAEAVKLFLKRLIGDEDFYYDISFGEKGSADEATPLSALGPDTCHALAPELLKLLKHKDENVRENAGVAITELHFLPKSLIPQLIDILEDPENWHTAIELLGAFGEDGTAALPALRPLLSHDETGKRVAARKAIRRITGKEVPFSEKDFALLREYAKGNLAQRIRAASELGVISQPGREQDVQVLLRLLDDQDVRVQLEAAKSLVKLDGPKHAKLILPVLLKCVQLTQSQTYGDQDDDSWQQAETESVLDDPWSRPFQPSSHPVAAYRILADLGEPAKSMVPVLLGLLGSKKTTAARGESRGFSIARCAGDSLRRLGPIVPVESLIKASRSDDPRTRGNAALGLGGSKAPAAVTRLIEMLDDKGNYDCIAYWGSMQPVGWERVLDDTLAGLRFSGQRAQSAVPHLLRRLASDKGEKRQAIVAALAAVGAPPEQVVPQILAINAKSDLGRAELLYSVALLDPSNAELIARIEREWNLPQSEEHDSEAKWQSLAYAVAEMGTHAEPLKPMLQRTALGSRVPYRKRVDAAFALARIAPENPRWLRILHRAELQAEGGLYAERLLRDWMEPSQW